jgi:hypothetical protein
MPGSIPQLLPELKPFRRLLRGKNQYFLACHAFLVDHIVFSINKDSILPTFRGFVSILGTPFEINDLIV